MGPLGPKVIVSKAFILPKRWIVLDMFIFAPKSCSGGCQFLPQGCPLGQANVMGKYFVGIINLALYFFAEVDMDGL